MAKIIVAAILCVGLYTGLAYCEAVSGLDIMKRNDATQVVNFEQGTISMTLTNSNNRVRHRKVAQKIMHTQKGLRYRFINFLSPGDVKGTKLLSLENKDDDDTQWIFMPAIKRARQISAANNTDSFVGTELSFEDLRREKLNEHTYTVIGEETIDGQPCYKIEAVPATPERKKISGYSKRILWIRKDNFVGVQSHFFDKKGDLMKVFQASDVRQLPSGHHRAFNFHLENVKINHTTDLLFSEIVIGKKINKRTFSVRNLK